MNSEQMKAFESLNTATQEVVKHMANDMQLVINQISNNQESLEKQIRESQAMVSQEIQSESKIIQTVSSANQQSYKYCPSMIQNTWFSVSNTYVQPEP